MKSNSSMTEKNNNLRVTFHEHANAEYRILNRYEYTAEETAATWLTEEDCRRIHTYTRDVVLLVINGDTRATTTSDTHTLCTRGLEAMTPAAMIQKRRARHDSMRTVLIEQEHPRYRFSSSTRRPAVAEKNIARHYRMVTQAAKTEARNMGILDAEQVWTTATNPDEASPSSERPTLLRYLGGGGRKYFSYPHPPQKVEMARSNDCHHPVAPTILHPTRKTAASRKRRNSSIVLVQWQCVRRVHAIVVAILMVIFSKYMF